MLVDRGEHVSSLEVMSAAAAVGRRCYQSLSLSLSVILPVPTISLVDARLADGAGVLLDQFRSGKDHLHALGSYLPC